MRAVSCGLLSLAALVMVRVGVLDGGIGNGKITSYLENHINENKHNAERLVKIQSNTSNHL